MGYIVQGILQARLLDWVAYPFSSGYSWPRNWIGNSFIAGGLFTNWAIREARNWIIILCPEWCQSPQPQSPVPLWGGVIAEGLSGLRDKRGNSGMVLGHTLPALSQGRIKTRVSEHSQARTSCIPASSRRDCEVPPGKWRCVFSLSFIKNKNKNKNPTKHL